MIRRTALLMVPLVMIAVASPANAIHFYRSTSGGCSAAEGHLTDDPVDPPSGPVTATVKLLHNLFLDEATNSSETRVKVGEAVRWTWNSSHCHSTQSSSPQFNSGFHYPTTPPESPRVLEGFFDYPVLDDTPTLEFTHTFLTPGTFSYFCVHHTTIGMNGTVIVES